MKTILTKNLHKEMEKNFIGKGLYSQENKKEKIFYAHISLPGNIAEWFICEYDIETKIAFGLCCLFEAELGYVSIQELEETNNSFLFSNQVFTLSSLEKYIAKKYGG